MLKQRNTFVMSRLFTSQKRVLFCALPLFLVLTQCATTEATTYTITVGAYTLDTSGNYEFTGNELVFHSHEECETWSRTAPPDAHSSTSHLHYNAATDKNYDHVTTTFTWIEYGPEIDQQGIEATCNAGIGGVSKTVDNQNYFQDKPNLFLKITSVIEN